MDRPEGLSVYARLFDETNPAWHANPEMNRTYLQVQERYLNHKLRAYGFIFLNDVYDALGFDRTPEGQLVGWMINPEHGAGYIDFGLYEARNTAFYGGLESTAWLDFNVDGVMFYKIPHNKGALMGDGEVTETTTTETTEVTAPEPSTPAQDVVDEVHTEVKESAPVVEETTTTTTVEETKESD